MAPNTAAIIPGIIASPGGGVGCGGCGAAHIVSERVNTAITSILFLIVFMVRFSF